MKVFIKKILKKISRKIYYWGDFSQLNERPPFIDAHNMVTYSNAFFYNDALIYNSQNNKNNIIVGDNSHIRGTLLIFPYGGKIVIGNDCYIGDGSRIWSAEEVTIGNDVLISHYVNIIDTNSHETDANERAINARISLKHGLPQKKGNVDSAAIIIEDNVWVSYNVSILKGVKIGKGAIIAAGTVVTKNVPPYSLFAGNPGKVIKDLMNTDE